MDVVVEGFGPFDGRYPFIKFNRYEQGQIRRLAGFMPLEVDAAFDGGDAELIAAVAVLAMKRAGRIDAEDVRETFTRLLDTDDVRIALDATMDDEEAEPESPPERSSNLSSDISGPGSSRSSETSEPTPKTNGTPASATSASVPTRSVS